MRAAVITFPGSNCDRDLACAFAALGAEVVRVWHKDTALPAGIDIVGIPGGFSYGDYLRCGAIAAQAPIMRAVAGFAAGGGFQVLTESGLLPGALMRNAGLKFICRSVDLRVEARDCAFLAGWDHGATIALPIAHHDGNYTADDATLARLQAEDRVALRYVRNPNGSCDDIAGVLSENRRVLGMMPHPERAIDLAQGGADGRALFAALCESLLSV